MARDRTTRRCFWAAALMLPALSACVGGGGPSGTRYAEVAGQIPKLSAQQVRFYFYRLYEPYESLSRPYIRLNGTPIAISEPGGVTYRDVAAGSYLVSVDSPGAYPNQDKTVTLSAGETIYIQIQSNRAYNQGFESYDPDTFVVAIIDPAQARSMIETMRYFPGS